MLENYHIASFFNMIEDPSNDCNIFQFIEKENPHLCKEIRQYIIDIVLWTDPSKLYDLLMLIKAKIGEPIHKEIDKMVL